MVPKIFKPIQSRTRNLSTGKFFKKCAQRHHAIYVSNFRAASRKDTSQFVQFLPVLVKISLKKFVVRRELYFDKWQPTHFMSLVIISKHCSVTNELCLIRVSICEYNLNFIKILNLSKSKCLAKFYLYSSVLG